MEAEADGTMTNVEIEDTYITQLAVRHWKELGRPEKARVRR